MSKKNLMILGAGRDQIPIIKLAKQMRFKTIVVSIAGNYPGFAIADRAYEVDVRNKEEILKLAIKENICGILTDQTDLPVPSVAYVAEKMHLPGIGYDCALRFTNKHLMRSYCKKIDVPVPNFFEASSFQYAYKKAKQLGSPFVVKPIDNNGSRGVAKVDKLSELKINFNNAIEHSACGRVILEKYIQGKEFIIQGFISNSKHTNLVIGDQSHFSIPNLFISNQTLFPSLLEQDLQNEILSMNNHMVESLKPEFGITYSEWLFDEDIGKFFLCEAAIRGGGVFMSSDLIPLACGINVNELLIKFAAGLDQDGICINKHYNKASGYVCFLLPEGNICRLDGVGKLKSIPGVQKVFLNDLKLDSQTKPLKDNSSRYGPILISGHDRKALNQTIRRIQETLVIEVQTSTGIKGIIW